MKLLVDQNAKLRVEPSQRPEATDGEVAFRVKACGICGSDIPRVFIVNVLNKGFLVPGIPEDFEVEVPALCSAAGVHPITTSSLPKTIIAHTLRDRVAPVEMELAAYENGSIDYLRELVLMDKWATSMKQVSAFVDEILDLPYHKEMKEHYR